MQAVLGHPWASVGVLLSPRGVSEPQAGVSPAGGVEKVDQGVAPPVVVRGPLFAVAVLEVLIGALVEAFPHRCWPGVVVVGRGLVRPVVPMPRRPVWHCQAARVAVPQLGGAQREDVAGGGLLLDVGCPGARDGVVEPHPQGGQGPGYALDRVAPCQGCELRDGVVYLKAYAVRAGDFQENILVTSARTEAERWWTGVPTRATAVCWQRVGTRVSLRVPSSCRLSCEASKAYRALFFATWTVIWSRWPAGSGSSAMKGATYCVTPPKIARMTPCTTFGGARVLRHQWCTAARRSRCLRCREKSPSGCSWSPR